MFIKVARHDQRGTANSSILISWDVGVGVGMLAGGVLAEYAGYAAAFGRLQRYRPVAQPCLYCVHAVFPTPPFVSRLRVDELLFE